MAKRKQKTPAELAGEAAGAVRQGEIRLERTAKQVVDAQGALANAERMHKQAGEILKTWQGKAKELQGALAG